jgi:hypothetical protein
VMCLRCRQYDRFVCPYRNETARLLLQLLYAIRVSFYLHIKRLKAENKDRQRKEAVL